MTFSRLCVVLLVAFVADTHLGGTGAQQPPAPTAVLAPCQPPGRAHTECGSVTVFENRAARRGRTIDIHFLVARADAGHAREALFVFAGGPGQGSISMSAAAGQLSAVRATMDIVFVDQRGTGASHSLRCPSNAASDPASAFGHVFDPSMVAQCRRRLEQDADLTQYTTESAAADIDDVRAALGYERVSLYGVSYGTRLAQAYVRRFAHRVKSVVLDGVVPFDNAIPLTYAASAQQALDKVFRACADRPDCRAAHPQLPADFAALLRRFDAGPVPAIVKAGTSEVTVKMSRGDFGYALRGILYGGNPVPRLPDMIERAAASRDVREFAQRYWAREAGMAGSIAFGLHLSVLCAEDVPFPAANDIDAAVAGTFLGRYLFDEYRSACAAWPRGAIAADARTPITARVPVLLVSGFFDPVTPPAFAERIAQSLPLARTVVMPNSGHGSLGGCALPLAIALFRTGALDDAAVRACGGG